MSKIRVGIVGGTGYTGAELLRLLAGHPEVEIDCVTSRGQAGTAVADHFPSLRGLVSAQYTEPDVQRLADCALVYFATPNGTAMHSVPALLEAGVRIIDLAADFRLADAGVWARWYGMEHACPELLDDAVYGLPEINRTAIRDAHLVANPGCYPTAVQLGFLPLLENRLIESSGLIADVKSGVSGAGRTQAMHARFCEVSDSFKAYAVSGHRHLPEIEQGLSRVSGGSVGLTFVPHLVPMIRGIHATLYARLVAADADIQTAFEQRYAREPFVDVLEPGAFPDTGHVRGSNVCQISWHRPQDGDTVVVLVAVDNLVKGAAGQAVQNMNIMFSLDECTALGGAGLSP